MGLKFYKAIVADLQGYPLIPCDVIGDKEMGRIEAFMKERPFPEDMYTKEEFLADMQTSGPYSLPIDVKQTTVDYVWEMLSDALLYHE